MMITQFFAGREAELERLAALSEEAFAGKARIASALRGGKR
jgi:hypothetical protein